MGGVESVDSLSFRQADLESWTVGGRYLLTLYRNLVRCPATYYLATSSKELATCLLYGFKDNRAALFIKE
jgi:hypothetical protein